MKNLIKAVPILAALVLLLSYLGFEQARIASATVLGNVSIVDPAATATDISYATFNGQISVKVVDADLTGGVTVVKLFSTSDGIGLDLILTGEAGTYLGTATMITGTTSSTAETLKVADGDTVSATYSDVDPAINRADTITIETLDPTISTLSPVDATITAAATQLLSVEIRDTLSGVDPASIKFIVGTTIIPTTEIPPDTTADITEDTTVVGQSATLTLGLTGVNYVSVKANDKAGNEIIFDADEDTVGDQGNKITVDTTAPTVASAITGNYWDTVSATTKLDKRTSIEVLFADNLTNIDEASVAAGDFAVVDHSVETADIFADKPRSVFLTVDPELLPDEKPKVTIVGDGLKDQAGNSLTSGEKTPSDGISPGLTISSLDSGDATNPTLAGKDDKVVITVTSDEKLAFAPTVKVSNIASGVTTTLSSKATGNTNEWTATTYKVVQTGGYNVWATGQDSTGNSGTAGLVANTDLNATGAEFFEGDVALPDPTLNPTDASTPTERDPFYVTIDFAGEGTEYTDDSHTTVTLTKLTYDGSSVLGQESSQDSKKYLLAITGITAAEHTVVVNATDVAGNAMGADLTVTFTVQTRGDFSLSISPGWNLVSIPGDPADTSINTVMADNPEISAVVTFDPNVPGGSLAAIRDVDGLFAGTLTDIDAQHGYWMLSDSFKALDIPIPPLGAGQAGLLPPTIPVKAGWNQIPVVDVVGDKAAGDDVNAVDYLDSIGSDVTRVYWFDTVGNQWSLVDHDNVATNLQVGKGYFVYVTVDGTLVP